MMVALSISVSSCSDDDNDNDDHDFHLERVNVKSAELPNQFNYGSIYEIKVNIELPNSCYFFYDQFDYVYEGSTRLIYPIAHVDGSDVCNPNITETLFSIPVKVLQYEPYVFKFYQGKDSDGKDIFLIIEVPVVSKNQKTIENSGIKTSDKVYE